jgi:hypothetical protein
MERVPPYLILNVLQNTKKKFKDMSIKCLQKKTGSGDTTLDMILMADLRMVYLKKL